MMKTVLSRDQDQSYSVARNNEPFDVCPDMAELNATGSLNTAARGVATTMIPTAAAFSTATIAAMPKIKGMLSKTQLDFVKETLQRQAIHTATDQVPADHAIHASLRLYLRDVVDGLPSKSTKLYMGCSWHEVDKFCEDVNAFFHFNLTDARDAARMQPYVLRSIETCLAPSDFMIQAKTWEANSLRLQDLIKLYFSLKGWDHRVCFGRDFNNIRVSTLMYRDSIYNVTKDLMGEAFVQTGACEALAYFLAPLSLIKEFGHITGVEYDLHTVRYLGEGDKYRTNVSLNFMNGSGGYCHDKDTWGFWVNNAGFMYHDGDRNYAFTIEVIERLSDMWLIKIGRSLVPITTYPVSTLIVLLQHERVLGIADFPSTVSRQTGNIDMCAATRIPVPEDEWNQLISYLSTLEHEDITHEKAMAQARSYHRGMSLLNSTLMSKWVTKPAYLESVAFSAVIHVMKAKSIYHDLKDHATSSPRFSLFRWLKSKFVGIDSFYEKLHGWIFQHDFSNIIANQYPDRVYRTFTTGKFAICDEIKLRMCVNYAASKGACEECDSITRLCNIHPDFVQIVKATRCGKTYHTFNFPSNISSQVIASLSKVQPEPMSQRAMEELMEEVKDVCKALVGASTRPEVQIVDGPAGTGKSVYVRSKVDACRKAGRPFIVICPVREIGVDDYMMYIENNEKFHFFTQHKAMVQKHFVVSGGVMIFDECFLMDKCLIDALVCRYSPAEVIFAGDPLQQEVQDGVIGTAFSSKYGGYKWDLWQMHSLTVNFRNQRDSIAAQNKLRRDLAESKGWTLPPMVFYGGKDKAKQTIYCYAENEPGCAAVQRFFEGQTKLRKFAFGTSAFIDKMAEKTVCASQGMTVDYAILYITRNDVGLLNLLTQPIVAISRHKIGLLIIHDDTPAVVAFLQMMGLNPYGGKPVTLDLDKWAPFPPSIDKVLVQNACLRKLLPVDQIKPPVEDTVVMHNYIDLIDGASPELDSLESWNCRGFPEGEFLSNHVDVTGRAYHNAQMKLEESFANFFQTVSDAPIIYTGGYPALYLDKEAYKGRCIIALDVLGSSEANPVPRVPSQAEMVELNNSFPWGTVQQLIGRKEHGVFRYRAFINTAFIDRFQKILIDLQGDKRANHRVNVYNDIYTRHNSLATAADRADKIEVTPAHAFFHDYLLQLNIFWKWQPHHMRFKLFGDLMQVLTPGITQMPTYVKRINHATQELLKHFTDIGYGVIKRDHIALPEGRVRYLTCAKPKSLEYEYLAVGPVGFRLTTPDVKKVHLNLAEMGKMVRYNNLIRRNFWYEGNCSLDCEKCMDVGLPHLCQGNHNVSDIEKLYEIKVSNSCTLLKPPARSCVEIFGDEADPEALRTVIRNHMGYLPDKRKTDHDLIEWCTQSGICLVSNGMPINPYTNTVISVWWGRDMIGLSKSDSDRFHQALPLEAPNHDIDENILLKALFVPMDESFRGTLQLASAPPETVYQDTEDAIIPSDDRTVPSFKDSGSSVVKYIFKKCTDMKDGCCAQEITGSVDPISLMALAKIKPVMVNYSNGMYLHDKYFPDLWLAHQQVCYARSVEHKVDVVYRLGWTGLSWHVQKLEDVTFSLGDRNAGNHAYLTRYLPTCRRAVRGYFKSETRIDSHYHETATLGFKPLSVAADLESPESFVLPHVKIKSPKKYDVNELVANICNIIQEPINAASGSLVYNQHRTTRLDKVALMEPGFTRKGRRVKSTMNKARCIRISLGQYYTVHNKHQLLHAIGKRCDGSAKDGPATVEMQTFANEIVKKFFDNFMNVQMLTDAELTHLYDDWLKDVRSRHYVERSKGENADDTPDITALRGHLKAQFKPSNLTKGDKYTSAGQTTLSWGPYATNLWQLTLRVVWAMICKSFNRTDPHKSKVFCSSRRNTDDYMRELMDALTKNSKNGARSMVFDVEKLDASYDTFARVLILTFYQWMGLSQAAAEELENYMKENKCNMMGIMFTLAMQLPSGSLFTFPANTILCMLCVCWICDWVGDAVLAGNGDDDILNAPFLRISQHAYDRWCKFSKLRVKYTEDDCADFCGMICVDGDFVPNLYRMFLKLVGYMVPADPDMGWKKFMEYQVNLRENVRRIESVGKEKVCAAMVLNRIMDTPSGRAQATVMEAFNVYDVYVSWAYASKEDFLKWTKVFEYESSWLSADREIEGGIVVPIMWGSEEEYNAVLS